MPAAQFIKDFKEPRSARSSTGFNASVQGPIGTILHCVTNTRIYCDLK
jgi:hypothetical protein